MNKSIICVDGNSIINRAFYGVRPLYSRTGKQTNAVFGMLNILNRLLQDLDPEYLVVCFDVHAKTFRHKMYSEYKAGRHATPTELLEQFEPAKNCICALGGTCVEKEGFEADDLIGTYAKRANDLGIKAYVLTGDRDSLQLISDDTTVILASTGENIYYTRQVFNDKYQIEPEQFVDLKALMGDSSDNIPGVPGIGEKTAIKLIQEFGSLDGLYSGYMDSSNIKQGVKDKLSAGKESAYFSQTLSRIVCDVDDIPSVEDVKKRDVNKIKLKELFVDLDFHKLVRVFDLEDVEINDKKEKTYILKEGEIKDLNYTDYSIIIDYMNDCVYYGNEKEVIKVKEIASQKSVLDNKDMNFSIYDIKEDYHMMKYYGINLDGVKDDVKLMGYVCNSNNNMSSIERTAQREFGVELNTFDEKVNCVYKLFELYKKQLDETEQYSLYKEIEFPLAHILYEMEDTGFKVDIKQLSELSQTLGLKQRELEDRIYMQAGCEFNINSTKQLGNILFEELNLPAGKKNKTGYRTDAETLEELRYFHPIVDDILEYRTNAKMKATYADGLMQQADENDLIHTCFKQALTATGRLSSTDPNLQNIPVKTELGREFRKCFIPRSSKNILIDADYSQIELRIMAAISDDENMIDAFNSNIDIHTSTAMKIFKVGANEVEIEMRKKAKAINFGILYGMGDFTLSNDLHITKKQAGEYIDEYLKSYPKVKEYLDQTVSQAKKDTFVKTMFGRRRYIPEISSTKKLEIMAGERIAKNSPIQGTAADIIKLAMINVDKKLKESNLNARLILQVHDELIVECSKDSKDEVMNILKNEMENACKLSVPLTVEIKSGENWLEAH